jgi:DNA-binding Lrp family transcriptional regulator
MRQLTEIDIQIIKELLKDGRKRFSTIAQECKTSKDIIWKHYKELKKAGVIIGASTQMDCRKLGYSGVATISISLETQNMVATFERLKNTPGLGIFRYYNTSNTLSSRYYKPRRFAARKEIISKQNKINEIRTNLCQMSVTSPKTYSTIKQKASKRLKLTNHHPSAPLSKSTPLT